MPKHKPPGELTAAEAERLKRVESRLAPQLARAALESWVARGYIDPKGKSELQLIEEMQRVLRNPRTELSITVDHTSTLREIANEMRNAGRSHLQLLILATWVEHVVNILVSIASARKRIAEAEEKQMIREVNLSSKLTWLLPLLGLRPFEKSHLSKLKKLSELRNQFVHYKWNDTKEDEIDELKRFLVNCEPSLKYLAAYRTRESLRGTGKLLRRTIRGPRVAAPNTSLERTRGR